MLLSRKQGVEETCMQCLLFVREKSEVTRRIWCRGVRARDVKIELSVFFMMGLRRGRLCLRDLRPPLGRRRRSLCFGV